MQFSGFDFFAWTASFAGQVALLVVLFARRRAHSFPVLTLYLVEQVINRVLAYFVLHHYSPSTYQDFYWSMGILEEILLLLIVYEIALHVFRPTGVWAKDVRPTLFSLAGMSAVVGLLLTWIAQPAAARPVQTFILRSNFFSAALMSELFVGMVVLSGTVGLPWKTHVARIAQGLGTYSLICVGLDIVVNFVGLVHHEHIYRGLVYFRDMTYIACEGYWIVMLWAKAPAPRELPEEMRMQIYTLQRQVENDLRRIRVWRRN